MILYRLPDPPTDDLGRSAEVGPELRRRVRPVAVGARIFSAVLVAVICIVLVIAPEGATIESTGLRGRADPYDASPAEMFIPLLLPVIFGGLLLFRPMELLRYGARVTRSGLIALVCLCAFIAVMEGFLIAETFGYEPFWRP